VAIFGRSFLVGLLMIASSSFAYAAPCPGNFLFTPNGRTNIEGTTRQNTVCTFRFGTVAAVVGYRVVTPPAHGTLGGAGNEGNSYLAAYKPRDGYVGSDSFVIGIKYVLHDSHLSTVLHIHMTITP
jgi:hypothetical protein